MAKAMTVRIPKKQPQDTHRMNRARFRQVVKLQQKRTEAVRAEYSQQILYDDIFSELYTTGGQGIKILEPTYKPGKLYYVHENSAFLPACTDAMVLNVHGFGYKIEPVEGMMADIQDDPVAQEEIERVKEIMENPNDRESGKSLRKNLGQDFEVTGNMYMEVIRDAGGAPALLFWADSRRVRVCAVDANPITITVEVKRKGSMASYKAVRYFRRYVMSAYQSTTEGNATDLSNLRFYKEYGDPRILDNKTGKYLSDIDIATMKKEGKEWQAATEMWHHKHGTGVYGVPRWIGNTFNVLGLSRADFVNWDLFDSQGIPPLIITVSGGRLTDESLEDLTDMIESLKGVKQFNKTLLLETEAVSTGGLNDSVSQVRVDVKSMIEYRQNDAMFVDYVEKGRKSIRESFRLPAILVGGSDGYNFACYSEDTETLTDRGWITYDQFVSGMKVATVNQRTLALEYQEPKEEEALVYDVYDIPMYHIDGKSADLLVTPKHRMFYSRYGDEELSVLPIEVMVGLSRVQFVNSVCSYIPENCPSGEDLTFDGIEIPTRLFMEFLGYFLSEGTSSQAKSQVGNLTLSQKKPDGLAKISACMDTLEKTGCKVYRYAVAANGVSVFTIKNHDLKAWMDSECGVGGRVKRIPRYILRYDYEHLRILFDAMMTGDGAWDSRDGRNSGAYSSVSFQLASDFQELAFKLGYRASMRRDHAGTFGRRPIYRVMIVSGPGRLDIHTDRNISRVSYTGKVYCFNVPNGVFVTRRNGKISIQGNTAVVSRTTTEEQVFVPERENFDDRFNLTILKDMGITKVKIKSEGPEVAADEFAARAVPHFIKNGAFTLNELIGYANKVLGTDIQLYEGKEWADVPLPVFLAIAKQLGMEEILGISARRPTPADDTASTTDSTGTDVAVSNIDLGEQKMQVIDLITKFVKKVA